jgi:catechol 2,3-dioxygenase-like lactoylglutathione lyase family enzyme
VSLQALTISHLVLATQDVPKMEAFFTYLFGVKAHYSHKEFVDFVLPGRSRVAFFTAVGAAAKHFKAQSQRNQIGIGITVTDVEALYTRAIDSTSVGMGVKVSGAPKDHPWGEKSFLLIDPDQNRWEITQSPSKDGLLINR